MARQRGQNTITARPPSTRAQAPSFHAGMASPRLSAEALMPNTGTSNAMGVTVGPGAVLVLLLAAMFKR